jgi:hypothetical protein
MAFMVIHLWGKFWMAAWRGRRALTWITGVVAFVASVVECFTGYLAQQNFDSQWIATNGKDAFNATGIGAFFNVLNLGQMLLWHVVLVPIILIALVGAHVLLVRVRGVSHPLPAKRISWRDRAGREAAAAADAAPWRGPTRRYDILKEGTIATAIALALVLIMAAVLSSPDVPPVSVQSWAKVAPTDFLGTAATELDGTGLAASYGPPYNSGTAAVQQVGPVNWQKLSGVTQPINAAQVFVLSPLSKVAPTDPALATALATYTSATPAQQQQWATAYGNAVTKVKFVNGAPVVPKAGDGPVPAMMAAELTMARSGGLDTDLLVQRPFYGTDFTKPLLFHRRRCLLRQPGAGHAPDRRPVGRDERDRQLPRPAVAVAVPAVVPRGTVQQLAERGRLGGLPDRHRHPAAARHPVHPRPARRPEADPGAPAHLAVRGPLSAGIRFGRQPGRRHDHRQVAGVTVPLASPLSRHSPRRPQLNEIFPAHSCRGDGLAGSARTGQRRSWPENEEAM